ncbi:MAG: SIMPL domain-containing protein [bacterium]|nr:SIMPL domain-containing protein [bacterium]
MEDKKHEEAGTHDSCCGSDGCRCGGSCVENGECGSFASRTSRWMGHNCRTCLCILGAVAGIFLAVWTVAKSLEVKHLLNYGPAGIVQHTVTFSATGKSAVSPDTAEIELSVLTEGKTPQDVQQENAKKMNAIIEFVKSSKIDAKDIKTAAYSLYPKYEYLRGQSNISGYTLTQSLRVKLHDLKQVGVILEGATTRGANQVGDVRFFVDDPDKFKEEASKEAFKKVDLKARELSRLAGVKLGRIISFSESGGDMPPPVFYGKAEAIGMGGGGAGSPQLEEGLQDISVTVSVTYRIE